MISKFEENGARMKFFKLHISNAALLVLSALLFSGCAPKAALTFMSTNDLNNGGNPVVVRVYQLKSAGNFQRATLDEFWQDDQAALGSDIVGDPVEVLLHPGETRNIKSMQIETDASFIGVAADFYSPEGDNWREIYQISDQKGLFKGFEIALAVGSDRLLVREID
jgi:type VI secretion system VasD/TssJ family lipoprotein